MIEWSIHDKDKGAIIQKSAWINFTHFIQESCPKWYASGTEWCEWCQVALNKWHGVLTNKKEEIEPLHPNYPGWYVVFPDAETLATFILTWS